MKTRVIPPFTKEVLLKLSPTEYEAVLQGQSLDECLKTMQFLQKYAPNWEPLKKLPSIIPIPRDTVRSGKLRHFLVKYENWVTPRSYVFCYQCGPHVNQPLDAVWFYRRCFWCSRTIPWKDRIAIPRIFVPEWLRWHTPIKYLIRERFIPIVKQWPQ